MLVIKLSQVFIKKASLLTAMKVTAVCQLQQLAQRRLSIMA
jgi:hypothetical protein